jgi:GTPase KRas
MSTVRIIIYRNAMTPGIGKNLLINLNMNFQDLLKECSKALGDEFRVIFDENGKKIGAVDGLRDGSRVYLSKGEGFKVPARGNYPMFVLLGEAGVGKSAITIRYVRNLFVKHYDPTIEDYYKHNTLINGENYHLSILDTAGMEDYEPLIDEWIDGKNVIFLVYSVEFPDSMIKLDKYCKKINNRFSSRNKPIVALVANKIDLARNVTTENGKRFAEKLNINYYEVSAATNQGINEMFSQVLLEFKRKTRASIPWYRRQFFVDLFQ